MGERFSCLKSSFGIEEGKWGGGRFEGGTNHKGRHQIFLLGESIPLNTMKL